MGPDESSDYSRRSVLQTAAGAGALLTMGTGVGAGQSATGYGAGGYGAGGYGGSSSSPSLSRFDTNGNGEIEASEAIAAVSAYNSRSKVDGKPVTAEDVMAVISAYNS